MSVRTIYRLFSVQHSLTYYSFFALGNEAPETWQSLSVTK